MRFLRLALVALAYAGLCACDPFNAPHFAQAPVTTTGAPAPTAAG